MQHVVVTGGGGLVGGNVVRALLAGDPDRRVQVLDLDPDPAPLRAYAGGGERLSYGVVDLTAPEPLARVDAPGTVTHVVHTAAFCHVPAWEVQDPGRFLDVNVEGTRRVMDWCRTLPQLERVVHVSSGGVYGDPSRWSTPEPQSEDGPFNPPETYAISKLAGEQVARRWGELFDLDVRVVRLSAVFGPLERRTPGRSLMSLPYAIARTRHRGEPLQVTERLLSAGGDWLSGVDAADAFVRLLGAPDLREPAYNVAFGEFTAATELLAAAARHAPDFSWEVGGGGEDMDPANRLARWNAYDTTRIRRDTGWAPRPLAEQLGEYLDWAAEDGSRVP